MKKIKRVAMLAHGFIGWGGGVDFLKAYLSPLQLLEDVEIFFIIMTQHSIVIKLKNTIKNILGLPIYNASVQEVDELARQFEALGANILICNCYTRFDFRKSLIHFLEQNQIDLIFPTLVNLGRDFPIPWVIYLPDFQHKYYPEFFSEKECADRDNNFRNILNDAEAVIVESNDTKKDIFRYYPNTKAKVHVMPYTAIPEKAWFCLDEIDISKYEIKRPYFLISNQLWMHKSHITALEALARLREEGYDVDLVCTGKTEDYRNPNYYEWIKNKIEELGIKDNVHFLGYIPKLDQIKLLKCSIAAVQPTLFEGNPGGGIAYNAISLGIPIILSDIPVNSELNSEFAVFFRAQNVDDLVLKMKDVYNNRFIYNRYTDEMLIKQGESRLDKLANAVKTVIDSIEERR